MSLQCSGESLNIDGNGIVSSVYAFKEGDSKCIKIPNSVFSFKDGNTVSNVFKEVSSDVEQIDFSDAINIQTIGSYTFYKCSKVQTFDLSKCSKLSSIGICAFCYCENAISIILPSDSNLKTLPGGCFAYCLSLPNFTVPKTVETIEKDNPDNYGVFAYDSNLYTVLFEEGSKCTHINTKVFYESGLVTIKLPKSLIYITGMSFRIVRNLTSIEVEDGCKYTSKDGILLLGNTLIYMPPNCTLINDNKMTLPEYITSFDSYCFAGFTIHILEIPSSITTLRQALFAFSEIVNIIIPESIQELPNSLFDSAYGLQNVTFYNRPLSISANCFSNCRSLTSFTIPDSVISLKDECFSNCQNLKDVYVPNSVVEFGTAVFVSCHANLQLHFAEDSNLSFYNNSLFQDDMTTLKFYIGNDPIPTIPSFVKKIDSAAFQNKRIQGVSYGYKDNITEIGTYAFANCINLMEIKLPNAITAINSYSFSQTALTTITIPSSVVIIDEGAFSQCNNLQSVIFNQQSQLKYVLQSSESLEIGNKAFYLCSSLSTIVLPSNTIKIEQEAFCGTKLSTFNLPDSLVYIGPYAFQSTSITSFETNDMIITNLTEFCFSQMPNLLTFKVPDSVIVIGRNVFYNCSLLKEVIFGEQLESVQENAFDTLESLENISLSNAIHLTDIGTNSFTNCPNLKTFKIESNSNFTFQQGMLINNITNELILYLKANEIKDIKIPANTKVISQYAFSDCPSIQSVTFEKPSQIEEIKLRAFQNCISLRTFKFPSSLRMLGSGVFQNCNLEIIYLHKTKITDLGANAFSGNKHVKQIVLPDCLETVADTAFADTFSNVYVFYHGSKTIENKAGLHNHARVYCYDDYQSEIFLGLPVQKDFKCPITQTVGMSFNHLTAYIILGVVKK